MKTNIPLLLKKHFPTLLKLLYKEAKKYDFDYKKIKENIQQDAREFAKEQIKQAVSKYVENNGSIEGFFGTILDDEVNENEMLLGGEEDLQNLPILINTIHEYNQLTFEKEFGKNLCFGYGNLGMTSDNTNKALTEKQEKKLAEKYTKTRGFIKNVGGYFSLGYNETCDFWEKELKIKLNRYVISTKTDDIITVLDKNISVAIGLKVSKEILKSMRDDGILQDEDVKGKIKYGHLARIKKIGTLYDISIIDNYSGTGKHNRYELEELKEFLKSEYVFENCRFVLAKDINKEIPNSQYAIQKLGLKNERLNDSITRFEVFSVAGSLIRYLEGK